MDALAVHNTLWASLHGDSSTIQRNQKQIEAWMPCTGFSLSLLVRMTPETHKPQLVLRPLRVTSR